MVLKLNKLLKFNSDFISTTTERQTIALRVKTPIFKQLEISSCITLQKDSDKKLSFLRQFSFYLE